MQNFVIIALKDVCINYQNREVKQERIDKIMEMLETISGLITFQCEFMSIPNNVC